MRITIQSDDYCSEDVLSITVNGKFFGELLPGKRVTIEGEQIAIAYERNIKDEVKSEQA